MSSDKHLKAQDVFSQTNWLLGTTSDFSEAFPGIQDVTVRVIERGGDLSSGCSERSYTQHDLGEYINCRNPRCYNGGFRIGAMLREMIAEDQTDAEFRKYCQGYEGSPKGRKNYGPCDSRFEVNIHIDYEQSPDA